MSGRAQLDDSGGSSSGRPRPGGARVAGLVGENGAGKTTVLRLVAGELAPDEGTIRIEPAGARVALCAQEVDRAGAGVVALAASHEAEACRVRGLLHLDPDRIAAWGSLSPGERRRWQIGAALAGAPHVFLLDEPTNHLDLPTVERLEAALAAWPGALLLVTHDERLGRACITSTWTVAGGTVRRG